MALLDLVQIVDSAFPSGAYAHSLGLEGLYALGDVDLEGYLGLVLTNSLERIELPVVRFSFVDADARELDALMDVVLPVKEARTASRSIGRAFLRAVNGVRRCDVDAEHHAVVFGAVLRSWRLDLEDGLQVYAFQALRQQLSAAQRLGKIGQSAMQDLLHRLKPAVCASVERSYALTRDEVGGFAPWLDLAGMAHEHQFARLFRS
jgi:urease accessory protein